VATGIHELNVGWALPTNENAKTMTMGNTSLHVIPVATGIHELNVGWALPTNENAKTMTIGNTSLHVIPVATGIQKLLQKKQKPGRWTMSPYMTA